MQCSTRRRRCTGTCPEQTLSVQGIPCLFLLRCSDPAIILKLHSFPRHLLLTHQRDGILTGHRNSGKAVTDTASVFSLSIRRPHSCLMQFENYERANSIIRNIIQNNNNCIIHSSFLTNQIRADVSAALLQKQQDSKSQHYVSSSVFGYT